MWGLGGVIRYCLADDNWVEAVKFLDLGDGAGWELLQVWIQPIHSCPQST